MIEDYFEFLKKIVAKNPSVKNFRLVREFIGVKDYSYHWQNKEKMLITRWDNASHHPEIETFPHHVHEGDEIKPSDVPTFVEILKR